MLRLETILGNLTTPNLAEQLHELEHAGKIEYVTLNAEDIKRKRLRVTTDRGTDCAIVLERGDRLENGSILYLEGDRAIVVRLPETQWLALKPKTLHAALELGYFAGNLHWQIEVASDTLRIALAGPERAYLEKIAPFLESGEVERIS